MRYPEGRDRERSRDEADCRIAQHDGQSGICGGRSPFRLEEDDPAAIRSAWTTFRRAERRSSPLEMPSAGSTFKRPEGYFAGKLIQDSDPRGYRVGGAQVSEKHTGFVVNAGNATAADVLQLIGDVQQRVRERLASSSSPKFVCGNSGSERPPQRRHEPFLIGNMSSPAEMNRIRQGCIVPSG